MTNEAEGWETWYLDDGLVVGSPERVAAFLGALFLALPQVGLELNLRKCSLWGPGVQECASRPVAYPEDMP